MATITGKKRALASETTLFARRTITMPPEMSTAIDERFGRGQFSAFAQRAFAHELQRERIAEWLDERLATAGPLPTEAVDFAEDAWQNRKRK